MKTRAKPHAVYVVDDGIGHVKIGMAVDPISRVKMLQNGHPKTLKLCFATETEGRNIESAVHRKLRDKHVGGEWFSCSVDEAISTINLVIDDMGATSSPIDVGIVYGRSESMGPHAKHIHFGGSDFERAISDWNDPDVSQREFVRRHGIQPRTMKKAFGDRRFELSEEGIAWRNPDISDAEFREMYGATRKSLEGYYGYRNDE